MRRLLAAATAAITLAGAGAAHAAAPAPWIGPVDLSASGFTGAIGCGFKSCPAIGAGDVALTAQGDLVAAWTRRDEAGTYRVEAVTRPAGGTFSAPRELGLAALEQIPTDTLNKRPSPVRVELDDAGVPVIAWLAPVGGKRVVQASINLAPGANVSSTGQDASDVKLAGNGAGETAAIWTRNDIVQAAVRAPGGTFGASQDLSAAGKTAHDPEIAIDPRGGVLAVWSDSTGVGRIQAASRVPGGNFGAPTFLSAAGADGHLPDVAFDATGRATVIWQRGNVIQSIARSAAGAFDAFPEDVGASNLVSARPRVAVNRDNTAVAVWLHQFLVQGATRPSGASFGAPQDVSATGVIVDHGVQVGIDAAGNARAVWVRGANTVESANKPAGGQFGGVDLLGTGAQPQVALDALGNAAAQFAAATAQVAPFDGSAPVFRELSVTAAEQSASALDVWSPVSVSWELGDGASATGERVAHQFGPGAFTVTARATDQFGRATVASRPLNVAAPPVVVAAPPPPVAAPLPAGPRVLTNLVGNNWDVRKKRFTVTLLVVRAPIPAGAVAEVRCLGKGCPFKAKRSKKVRKGEINLLSLLSKRERKGLRAGQTVEVRLTAPGVTGRAVKFALKANKVPKPAGRSL